MTGAAEIKSVYRKTDISLQENRFRNHNSATESALISIINLKGFNDYMKWKSMVFSRIREVRVAELTVEITL